MARLSGKAGAVNVATADVAGIKSWTLDYSYDALEGTGFDSSGHRVYTVGIDGWSGTFEGFKNAAPLTIGSEIALMLKESATTTQKFSGQAIITDFSANNAVDGLTEYSYTYQGTGELIIATA